MRRLNIPESLVVTKFFFRCLQINQNQLSVDFWSVPQPDLTERGNLSGLDGIPEISAPFIRSLGLWKKILQTIKSYMSNGNVETLFDEWCNDEDDGNKRAERGALINFVQDTDTLQ